MITNKVLVKLSANYADEFDVDSLLVTTQEEAKELLTNIRLHFNPNKEYYFGSNECVSFDSVEELLDSITIIPISDEFYYEFKKHISPDGNFGLIDIDRFAE